MQERLAKLVGGVAVIKVGAATETEMKEKKARVEDAMHATRAAVKKALSRRRRGLTRCVSALDRLKVEGDEQIGINIVKRALVRAAAPDRRELRRRGAIVLGKVNDSKDNNFGYNALTATTKTWSSGACSTRPRCAHCPAECRLNRVVDADYRSARGGDSGKREGRCAPAHGGMGDMY